MEKQQPDLSPAEEQETEHTVPTAPDEIEPVEDTSAHDEEHAHSNYRFALRVLAVLIVIILIIVILKASGVPIAIKDWLFGFVAHIRPVVAGCRIPLL